MSRLYDKDDIEVVLDTTKEQYDDKITADLRPYDIVINALKLAAKNVEKREDKIKIEKLIVGVEYLKYDIEWGHTEKDV